MKMLLSTAASAGPHARGCTFSIAAALVIVAIAGCGGSGHQGPALTHDQFVREMKAICRTQNDKLKGVERGDPASDRRWVAAARDALEALQALNPPKRDEKRLRNAFAHWSTAIDDLEELVHALETNKTREGAKAFRAMSAEVRTIADLIPDYPAQACWGRRRRFCSSCDRGRAAT